jgi:hypothetical protein
LWKIYATSLIDAFSSSLIVSLFDLLDLKPTKSSIPYKEQHSMCVCYNLAKSHPEHMLVGTPNDRLEIHPSDENTEWMKEADDMVDVENNGLDTFQLKPTHLKSDELFCHMVQRGLCGQMIKSHDLSLFMDVKYTNDQVEEPPPPIKIT